ncbi:MAG: hypothetical protein WDA72_01250 [Desulfomonilia bacterium]|nr:hypothetical protein [Deltaproteobacteria bacterium]MDX9761600.1 hypothetical protein [Desulfomonilia bacterium]HPW68465.1 hypothetical protein [Deltaproteobacteria bacterium]
MAAGSGSGQQGKGDQAFTRGRSAHDVVNRGDFSAWRIRQGRSKCR